MSKRLARLFLRLTSLSPLNQSAIDFLSETLLWFGARGVSEMKICPNCQQQFPDGFQYCPDDTEHLITGEEFERRTRRPEQNEPVRAIPPGLPGATAQASNFGFSIPEQPSLIARLIAGLRSVSDSFKTAPSVRPGAAGDFQFLLKEESLVSRISRELLGAWNEFRRNPRVFISEFVRGEGTNRFRRNALLAGSELALTGFFTLYFFS
ncbi:MAG TPA: hypothetical protein VI479_03225, partial [Blastocatellia bacterium]